jgi:hypothetical protein
MPWFESFCRQLGLTIHEIVKPVKPQEKSHKETISHKVEEEKLNEKVTLRRTTIEEVEITPGSPDASESGAANTKDDTKPRD